MSSTTAPGTELRPMDRRSQDREARRVILSSYLGSTIEYDDFLLYASASALVFPHVFFHDLDLVAGVLASDGTVAAGYLARPLGGAIFGHFGDELGRKKLHADRADPVLREHRFVGCDPAHPAARIPGHPGFRRCALRRRQILTISISNPCDYG